MTFELDFKIRQVGKGIPGREDNVSKGMWKSTACLVHIDEFLATMGR